MTSQPSLFDGKTFDPAQDEDRLKTQLGRVYHWLSWNPTWNTDEQWWTLGELRERVGGSEAGISARIRDLRKPKFGGYTIERRRRGGSGGTWEYRMVIE